VFITSFGQPLVWGAHDISAERSKTEDVLRHIENLINETEEKNIFIKAFISDSAGEYAAARYVYFNSVSFNLLQTLILFIIKIYLFNFQLKCLVAKFNPERINVTHSNGIPSLAANKSSSLRNGTRKLPDDIADTVNDSEFWSTLFELQDMLYPLCGFLNKLQKDTARLYEVLHCFGYTIKILGGHQNF